MNIRIGILAILASASCLSAAQIAKDSATDSVYVVGQEYIQVGTPPGNQTAATNGLNGGFGFNQWQRGGYGTPPSNGTTLITAIAESFGMGAKQFGMRSGPGGVEGADARRRLLNPIIVGDTIRFAMMAGGNGAGTINTSGEFGAEIRSSLLSNPGRDMCTIIGEMGRNWRVFRSGGTLESTLPVVAGERVDVLFRVLPNDQFQCTFYGPNGACSSVSGTFLSLGQTVQTVQFYCFNTNGDFYMNDLAAYSGLSPTSYTIASGDPFGGDLDSLGGRDDNYLFVLNDENGPTADVRFSAPCISQPTTSATLRYEVSATRTDLAVFLDTFKFGATNNWVNREVTISTLTDNYRTFMLSGANLADFVGGANSEALARIRFIPQEDLIAEDGWSERIDYFNWVLN